MSKMLHIFVGMLLMIFVPVWIIFISPYILQTPNDFLSTASMVHTENNRFEMNTEWSGMSLTTSSSEISARKNGPDQLNIQTRFAVQSLLGEILFELRQNFVADPITRLN